MPSAETYTSEFHRTSYAYIDPSQPRLSTSGKTVLITGGGYGIGAGIARSFARSSASNIILTGRTLSRLNEHKASLEAEFPKTKVQVFTMDITDAEGVDKVFSTVVSSVAPIDIVVNNAAFLPEISPIKNADLKDWWRGFEVNVLGTATVTRTFLATKPEGRKGVVININTSVAHYGVFPAYSSYVASKMAVLRMTESFQAENPEVRFTSLQPGGVQTEMYAKFKMPEDYAMTDLSLPSDMSVWLSSDEADFVGGRLIWTNWDAEELVKRKEEIISKNHLTTGLRPIEGDLY
uniref:Putative short-chain dehydrogenase/reductase n=1 Tax=Cladonia uncialis subsp. uncialis TaxID=180999 RepID=A0A1Z1C4P9_CLAUC|nr:putative short-chain dehydrogenase/reductase [Cladonia uncialis subsp. uncialis]AUW31360.1 putative short-chain dehydrogenase/reductase [Cladonia uncialis subsp. uncialis]